MFRLLLFLSPLLGGEVASFTVQGATPGSEIRLAASLRGTGAGPCPQAFGGQCLGIESPIILGSTSADALGEAVFNVRMPARFEGRTPFFQAIEVDGADTQLSPPTGGTILPCLDDDLDGVCSIYDLCLGDDATGDTDNDGICDDREDPVDIATENQESVSCTDAGDCLTGEACEAGICQISRCPSNYSSAAPLGSRFPIREENEVVVLVEDFWTADQYVWEYDTADTQLARIAGNNPGSRETLDIAGGHVLNARPNAVILAKQGTSEVTLMHPTRGRVVDAGIRPHFVAAGDIDGSGLDDVIAVRNNGAWAACDAEAMACTQGTVFGVEVIDATAGDVDGDGLDEIVMAVETTSGRWGIAVVHPMTVADDPVDETLDFAGDAPVAITAGDLDGDGRAEIVTLHDGDLLDLWPDKLKTLRYGTDRLITLDNSSEIDEHELIDLEAADLNGQGEARLVVITDDEEARVLVRRQNGAWAAGPRVDIDEGDSTKRVTLADRDGNAIMGRLRAGPSLLPGARVPLAVLHHGPYYEDLADFPSSVAYETSSGSGGSSTNSVSLGLTATVGYSSGLIGGSVQATLAATTGQAITHGTSRTVQSSFEITADPTTQGAHSAAVVLGWGCYHGYDYEIDDPDQLTAEGADGEHFMLSVPVGGGTTVWSSHRYDAVVNAAGVGTRVRVPHEVGDASSYPAAPQLPNGDPIPADAMLFDPLTQYLTSDIARVGWSYQLSDSTSIDTSQGLSFGASAGLSSFGFSFSGGATLGLSSSYTVRAERSTRFYGSIPPVRDNPNTPADEFAAYRFAVTPYVYVRDLRTPDGVQVSTFVVDYAVQ